MTYRIFGAIDVGSYEVNLKIYELSMKNGIRLLNHVRHRLDLGSDTYATGKIGTELVDELLDISKIDMGRQRLALSETDIRELLYDGIRAVEPIAAGGITIVPDFPEEPVMVSCDDTQLRRAVTNILSNGVRYARSELRLTCRADKRHVTIRIQDDGDGIAEEDIPHIFDRFYMGRSGKSGIGLALTKEIIHLHRGTIRAYNGETGAVFEISIPVSR